MQTDPLVPWVHDKGPVGIRFVTLEAVCEVLTTQDHPYDHLTMVIFGKVDAWAAAYPGGPLEALGTFGPGDSFVTKAHCEHRFKALEIPERHACIFSHRDLGGAVVQVYDAETCLPPEKAYA